MQHQPPHQRPHQHHHSYSMGKDLAHFFSNVMDTWSQTGFLYAFMAIIFAVLVRNNECNRGLRYWQKGNVVVDLCYWFIVPIFSKYLKIGLLVIAAQHLFGLTTAAEQNAYFEHGYGMFSHLPVLAQALLILIFSDIVLYWMHRSFHGARLWKFHAIHHSSKDLDWPSAVRFHPINSWTTFMIVDICMVLVGFAPEAFIWLVPFNVFYSSYVHANLNWKMGWLGYVLASPVFHRWHHTSPKEGGNKNFAPTFPVLDMIFGTYYMPKDRLPEVYGVDDPDFPINDFVAQLFYPFKR